MARTSSVRSRVLEQQTRANPAGLGFSLEETP
jgi:hypothetical protein